MVKKKISLLIAMGALLLSACQKDTPDFTGFDNITGDIIEGNYQPTNKDSYWKYAGSGDGQEPDTTVAIMLGTTLTSGGKTYKVASNKFSGDDEPGTVNFYHSGNIYSIREISDTDTSELLYLKADAALGTTWDADLYHPATESKAIGKLLEKGISKTVLGKTFKDVVHTHLDLQVKESSGAFVTSASVDFYIAKDIGIIEEDVVVLGISGKSQLFEYAIK